MEMYFKTKVLLDVDFIEKVKPLYFKPDFFKRNINDKQHTTSSFIILENCLKYKKNMAIFNM